MAEPSTSELQRLITRNHRESSNDIAELKTAIDRLRADFLLAKVYESDQRALTERVKRLEDGATTAVRENAARARSIRAAYWAAAGAVLATVIGVVLAYLLSLGGQGH